MLKDLSEYICGQLKYHQHMIQSEIDFLLEIIINFFKFLTISFVALKYLFWHEASTLLKKRPWHRCFPVSFAKFLRTPFLTEHLWLLLLKTRIF